VGTPAAKRRSRRCAPPARRALTSSVSASTYTCESGWLYFLALTIMRRTSRAMSSTVYREPLLMAMLMSASDTGRAMTS
jgi:hypothetical protein